MEFCGHYSFSVRAKLYFSSLRDPVTYSLLRKQTNKRFCFSVCSNSSSEATYKYILCTVNVATGGRTPMAYLFYTGV